MFPCSPNNIINVSILDFNCKKFQQIRFKRIPPFWVIFICCAHTHLSAYHAKIEDKIKEILRSHICVTHPRPCRIKSRYEVSDIPDCYQRCTCVFSFRSVEQWLSVYSNKRNFSGVRTLKLVDTFLKITLWYFCTCCIGFKLCQLFSIINTMSKQMCLVVLEVSLIMWWIHKG